MLKTNQIQNGLKHSEYSVYRKYCSRKVQTMRRKILLKYGGKKRKTEKKMGMGPRNRIEFFWITLYTAERFWAQAMELKQGLNDPKKKDLVRHNVVKKLKRAVQWANYFKDQVQEAGCKRTVLEAESQSLFFTGLLNVERRNAKKALEEFLRARAIVGQLLEMVGSIEKVHLTERMEQIDNNIRFCRFQLNEYSGKADELAEMQKVLMTDQTLGMNLEDLADQMKGSAGNQSGESVKRTVFGQEVEIQHEKLIHILKELDLLERSMQTELSKTESREKQHQNFTTAFNKLDEASKFCDQQAETKGISEALQKLWTKIGTYFKATKSQKLLERNWILLHQLLEKFTDQKGYESLFLTKVDFKNTKPQDIIKLCDLSIQVLQSLRDMATSLRADSDREDLIDRFYSYLRGVFVAFYHVSQSNHLFSLSLFSQLSKRADGLQKALEKEVSDKIFVR